MKDNELSYFVTRTDDRLQRIEDAVMRIEKFRWQIIGGAAVVSCVVSIIVTIAYGGR